MSNKTCLVSALFLVFLLTCAFCAPALSATAHETEQSEGFTLNDWAVDQKLVQPNEDVKIEGMIENHVNDGDDDKVILSVNGNQVDSQEVYVEAGESKQISFTHSEENEGTYTVSVRLDSYDSEWDEGEFRVELVTRIEIEPSEDQVIEAGDEIDFAAAAYSGDNDPKTDDTIFTWENADETGLFDDAETGEYKVTATYNDVSSPTVNVTVEPADAAELRIIQEPSKETITAGETAKYTVQVQDGYGNEQTDGSFQVALEVEGLEPRRRHSTTIEDGESEASLDWSTTSEKQGDYNIEIIEVQSDGSSLNSDETTLTITEEDENILAGYWWSLPLVLLGLIVIAVSYLWSTGKIDLNLSRKRKAETHEWKRNEEEAEEKSN